MAIRQLQRTKQKRAVAANEALVRRFLTGFLNGRDVAVAEQVLADDFMSHDADLGDSRSSFVMFFEGLFGQIPEIRFEEMHIISDGDFVWVRNDVFESDASEVPFVSSVDIWRVEGDQLVEHWNVVQEHDPSVHEGNGGQEAFGQLGPWPFQGFPTTTISSMPLPSSGVFEGEQNGFGRVVRAFQTRMDEEWRVGAARDLEIIERDSWDGNEARRNMLEAGVDVARRGHLVYDVEAEEETQAAYRLPFADVVDGELVAVDAGLRAAASRLPQTDIPDNVRERARAVLDFYFEQMEEERVTKAKRVTMRGPGLAAYLTDQIDQLVSDERSRDDIIGEIAEDSGDSPSVIREILAGDVIRPDDECLGSFASVLGVPMARLRELADEDWEAHQENRQVENNLFRRVMRSIVRQFGDGQFTAEEEVNTNSGNTNEEGEECGVLSSEFGVEGVDGGQDETIGESDGAAGESSLTHEDGNRVPVALREMMQQRDIGLSQVVDQVCREIDARDPEDWNLWHWFKDLYFDDQAMYAITVSAGQLFRWPVMVVGSDVTLGEPFAVEVEFVPAPDRMMVRQDEDGRLWGFGPLCTATVNKAGILDSRGLFDSFVERFEGDGAEYLNILHLNGDMSRIGSLRHVYRDDKVLAGIYEFDKDDPIAVAAARTLMEDDEGYWGGSIEFDHYGALEMIEVAEGISLPTTTDGKLFGYSIARNQDCCAWYTGNSVHSVRSMDMAMSAKDREVALELLKDEELVNQLEDRIGMTNEGLRDAITYTLSSELGVQSSEFGVQSSESEGVGVNGLAHLSTDLPGPFLVSSDDGFADEAVLELGSRLDSLEAQMQFFSDLVLRVEQFGRRLEALEALVQAEDGQPPTGSGVDASFSSISSTSSSVAETVNQKGEAVGELADFTWIRGIGDAKEQRLYAAGILTYEQFMNVDIERIAELLDVSSTTVARMALEIGSKLSEGDES